jgi:low temperature requirement protein LtrA
VTRTLMKLTVIWALLMALAGGEFVVSGMRMHAANRPLLFLFTGVMVFLVGMLFMRLKQAPTVAKGFAVAAVFWLIVLFGLGSMDALTRSWYPVQHYNPY